MDIIPAFREMSDQWTHVKAYGVDIDQQHGVAREMRTNDIPTFKLFREGKLVKQVVGANSTAMKVF